MGKAVIRAVRIGLDSVWENAVPMVVLWALALMVVSAYYLIPCVPVVLEPVRVWQERTGSLAAFANCSFFCGVLPYLVYRCRRRHCLCRPLMTATVQALWVGVCGVACNWFFGLQAVWFGDGHDFRTVFVKMVVDQFGWTVLVIAPANALFYALLGGKWRGGITSQSLRRFFGTDYLPNLFMGWCVWIPVISIVYAFPKALQIQVLGLISASWVIVCREIGANR